VRKEVTLLDETMRKRPGIVVILPDSELAIDVTIVCVQNESTLDYVADAKRKKYAYLADENIRFVPFVMGQFHHQCDELLKLAGSSPREVQFATDLPSLTEKERLQHSTTVLQHQKCCNTRQFDGHCLKQNGFVLF
jgi:hypothetical protein